MKSGATESCFYYLAQHYKFPENVDVKRTTHEIIQSNNQYKVIWAHDNCDQAGHATLPQHIDKIDKIVCVSNWEREQYIKYNRAPAEKLTVIPNGVDDMFRPSGKPKSKTCIFFSAPHKGITPLVPIWKEVIKHHPDAKLKVFSSMSLYGAIQPGEGENETITTDKGLEPSPFIPVYKELQALPGIEYSPCIDREELLPHIQDAAFYIHPNVWEETFCVSLAEAMSCGCFPITTDMGALPETSNGMGKYIPMSGKNTSRGWITDDIFHQNFAEEVIRALHFFDVARDEYEQVSQKISQFAIESYTWKRVAGMWRTFISQLTNAPKEINVCFSTIPSRFCNLEKVIQSFQSQTLRPNKVIITVPEKYHRFTYQKQEIESICKKYSDFVHLLYVKNDYGPATKIYGALKSLELYPNSDIIVCDDDVIYDNRLVSCYAKSLESSDECVWTTAKSTEHNANDLKLPNHQIHKLQGVDTYLFTQKILEKINSENFEKKYTKFLIQNTDIKSLDDVFLHDDYFVSILLYDHQIPVKTFYLKHTVYDGLVADNQIHESLKCHSDEVRLIQRLYKNYENTDVIIRCDFTKVNGEKVGEFWIEGELNENEYREYIIDIHKKYGPFKIAININPEETMNALLDRKTTDILEFYDWQIRYSQMPEEHIDYLFRLKYWNNFHPKVIYDIGSNYLSWFRLASNVWNDSKIYCIDAFSGFGDVYSRYNMDYAIEVLSSAEEEIEFYENPKCPGLCSMYKVNEEHDPDKNFHNQFLNKTLRRTKTLDSLVKEKNWMKPDLIKMDVQGAEVNVLEGAKEVIQSCNHLILEVQTKEFSTGAPMLEDVKKYMKSIGFVLFHKIGYNNSKCDGDYHFVRETLLQNNREVKFDILNERNLKTPEEYYEWSSSVNMLPPSHIHYLYDLKYKDNFQPRVIYDIGSGVLHWAKFASCVWNSSELYHIDGFPGYESLYQKNQLQYAIEVLSDKKKEVTFYENLKSSGSSSYYEMNYERFPENINFKNSPYYQERKVITKTLDELISERNWKLPDLIKMDIQGCELDVLKGARQTLKTCRHLILELQHKNYMKNAPINSEVISYLENEGYVLISNFTQNPSGVDGDYHFVRKDLLVA